MGEKLIGLVGKKVLIVQIDGKVYKGRVTGADDQILVLTDVAETVGGREIKWKTPVVTLPGENGKPNQTELKDVLLPITGIVRIWPLGEMEVEEIKKEGVRKPGVAAQYVIRRIGPQDSSLQ